MAVFDGSFFPVKDFAYGTVLTAPSPASSGTSLVLNSGEGALFPAPATAGAFRAYVWPAGSNPDQTNCEEIEVTAISTDTFTIVRAKNGVTRSILVGDQVAINFGKSKEDQIIQAIKDGVFEDKLLPSESYSRDSTIQFKTPGDKTGWYTQGRIIRVNNAGTYSVHTVVSSSYSSPNTTVIVTGADLPAALTNVYVAIQPKGLTKLFHDSIDPIHKINAPDGFLINGKIVPSVASNNLTVAIKGMDGNDPSPTNPVFVRIDGVLRSITAALSVTKNAGTNWFNNGHADHATYERDYFVHLGYNATDGVVIGFAQFPGKTYSDFSTTSTNAKYCAISTITNASANDVYQVVGRFAATLSASASYNWSVPTFTAINLIQRPIYFSRWLFYSPTLSWSGTAPTGTPTKASSHFKVVDDTCFIELFYYNYTAGNITQVAINTIFPVARFGFGGNGMVTNVQTPTLTYIQVEGGASLFTLFGTCTVANRLNAAIFHTF